MLLCGSNPSSSLVRQLYSLLQGCVRRKELRHGRKVHHIITENGLDADRVLGNCLVHMFVACGSSHEATSMFHRLPRPNAFTWRIIVSAFVENEQEEQAIRLYYEMRRQVAVPVCPRAFVPALKACSNLSAAEEGRLIHADILESGHEMDTFVGNNLVSMYVRCASLLDAHLVFDKLAARDVVTWTVLISGYASQANVFEALQVFCRMQQEGIEPNEVTYICVLKACASIGAVYQGKLIHGLMIVQGFAMSNSVGSCLVDLYVKCKSFQDAWTVFYKLTEKDVVTWSAMIAGYVEAGDGLGALKLLDEMQDEGKEPNHITLVNSLKACAVSLDFFRGQLLHTLVINQGLELDLFIGSILIDMYAKCGSITDARNVYNKLQKKNAVTCNALITAYAQAGESQEAFSLFIYMQQQGLQSCDVTYVSLLTACLSSNTLDCGRLIHIHVLRNSLEKNLIIGNALIDVYAKGSNLKDAQKVFDDLPGRDIVSWSGMIAGYTQHGHGQKALDLFQHLLKHGVEPDHVTYLYVIQACSSSIGFLEQGKIVHSQLVAHEYELDVHIGSTLIDMYTKCGKLEDARVLFDRMPKRTPVTWTTMISGYVSNDSSEEALCLFQKMQQGGLDLDSVSLVSSLKACSSRSALNQGKWIHNYLVDTGFLVDAYIGSALIYMYAGCGNIEDACNVFDRMTMPTVVVWNAIICGLSQHGSWKLALHYLEEMRHHGTKPDEVTFSCLLSSLSQEGVVQEGYAVFRLMVINNGLKPTKDHYNCMIDLLGRAGYLNEAEELLQMFASTDNVMGWTCLLNHCRTHGNLEVGRRCFDHVDLAHSEHAPGYVLMSCIYSDAGLLDEAEKMQELKMCAQAWRKAGKAFIEVNRHVHDFTVGDSSHPAMDFILARLSMFSVKMKVLGYVPH